MYVHMYVCMYLVGWRLVYRYPHHVCYTIVMVLVHRRFTTPDGFITALKVPCVHMQINVQKKGVEYVQSTNNKWNAIRCLVNGTSPWSPIGQFQRQPPPWRSAQWWLRSWQSPQGLCVGCPSQDAVPQFMTRVQSRRLATLLEFVQQVLWRCSLQE